MHPPCTRLTFERARDVRGFTRGRLRVQRFHVLLCGAVHVRYSLDFERSGGFGEKFGRFGALPEDGPKPGEDLTHEQCVCILHCHLRRRAAVAGVDRIRPQAELVCYEMSGCVMR